MSNIKENLPHVKHFIQFINPDEKDPFYARPFTELFSIFFFLFLRVFEGIKEKL